MKLAMLTFAFGIFAVVSCASASSNAVTHITTPLLRAYPYAYSAHSSSLVTPTHQQYHTQDGLGQYAYGYAEPHSAKHEVRSLDGITRGSYSYHDPTGKLQTVNYTADKYGYRVAPKNSPLTAARSNTGSIQLAQPLDDTVAVAAGKADHLRRHEQEKQLHELIQHGRVISPISNTIIPNIYHYGYPWRYYY